MAGIPLALTLPVAAGTLAYLNARTSFTDDLSSLKTFVITTVAVARAQKKDTINMFYNLEGHAFDVKTANHAFIAVPPELPKDRQISVEEVRGLKCQEWSYRETYDLVLKYAAWLKNEHGVVKDDVVAFKFNNKPTFVFIWLAMWSLGARPAFINTSLRGEGLLHCVKISNAELLIVDADLQDSLTEQVRIALATELGKEVQVVVVDMGTEARILMKEGYRACDDCRQGVDPNGMSQLIFTSGTTGLPKAATITWRRCLTNAVGIYSFLDFRSDERYYSALPLYHSSANLLGLGMSLYGGVTYIISPHFSPRTFFASVTASEATTVQYIGEMCRYLLSSPPTPFDQAHVVRRCFGNGLRPDVWKAFRERFAISGIYEFYGATESPAAAVIKSHNNFGEGAVGRVGTLLNVLRSGQRLLIKHDVDTGEPYRDSKTGFCLKAETGEPGELLSWLDPADIGDKYAGYYGNDEATSSKILRDVLKRGDAYFRTGDLLKDDKYGRTYFVDRIGDTFRWKGENVSTGEVEKVVGQHPSVAEANVYGVELPGHDGRAGCAAVMWQDEPSEKTLRDLTDYVKKTLPKFAAPIFLRSVKSMETTGTTKYLKTALRAAGVDPSKVGEDKIYWLDPKSGVYREFRPQDWQSITGGQTRL